MSVLFWLCVDCVGLEKCARQCVCVYGGLVVASGDAR